ncbi:GMC oxidoreductase [Rhodofomes roseus]|uniref:GMC oxidoreductase n=1 Tax=Rhodofomes roseus TaxID=34475 RepID=A0ABQ8K6F3_9APHY|nr:GMC oxidoreductase [Rhodofomes roseus]KAH9832472.1 GMC oxidoreductase [Rhodofomes roseus]
MRPVALLSAASAVGAALAVAHPRDPSDDLHERQLLRRNIVYDGQIADSYDYIIVGGGTAGLVLANRLSQDSNTSVLVLEAGDSGDSVKSQIGVSRLSWLFAGRPARQGTFDVSRRAVPITGQLSPTRGAHCPFTRLSVAERPPRTADIPSMTYYDSLVGTSYDWQYTTTAQTNSNNRQLTWPRGKVLGGSSAINGMYLVRPDALEINEWASLVDNGSIWNWDNLFADMKKSESYSAPSSSVQSVLNVQANTSAHGSDGPIHASYPGYVVPAVGAWTDTLNAVGVASSSDPDSGDGWGAFIATSAINPSNWTRSYSRSGYLDPLPPRSNLAILPNATVTKLVLSNATGGMAASSVQYASAKGATSNSVSVNKEVILAAGAVGSPQILMVSGVGPEDVLQAAGVPVNVALPGVGQHLQDHIYAEVQWKTSDQTGATMYFGNYSSGAPTTSTPFLSFINSATAYVNFSTLVSGADTYAQQIAAAVDTSAASLVPSQYSEVVEGYKAIYNLTAQKFLTSSVGHMEMLLSYTGAGADNQEIVAVQAALQHPFSQGRLYISSSSVFDAPVIDPNYLSHEADITTLREGLKLCRIIGNTAPLSQYMGEETAPGSSVQTDDEWDAWLAKNIYTEYHPSCSCAMLPQSLGGVVDANLKVYGLTNVRVADSSVFPFEFSAHLQAPVYGLAEQAASLIKGTYTNVDTSASASASATSAGSSATTSSGSDQKSAAFAVGVPAWTALLGLVGVLAGAGLVL